MAQELSTVADEQFLREIPPGTPLQLRVEGEGLESFLGGARCSYFEWVYGEKQEGRFSEFVVAYHSEEPIPVVAAGMKSSISPRRVRLFLSPSVEREYKAGDQSAPEVVREYLAEGHASAVAAEYSLVPGKTYHARIHQDVYALPPRGPGSAPEQGRRLVLWISDAPFEDGKPAVEVTPAYRGWSY